VRLLEALVPPMSWDSKYRHAPIIGPDRKRCEVCQLSKCPRLTNAPSFVSFVVPHKNCQSPSLSWFTSRTGSPSRTHLVVKHARFFPSWKGQEEESLKTGWRARNAAG
jgi:hypothetical protein